MTTPREVTVETFVARHQVRQYLRVQGIEWTEVSLTGDRVGFRFEATDDQWVDVQAWVEKVTG
jgi:nucleoside-triphosphatase THEP1